MYEWFANLSASDQIALFSAVSSLILATAALWQSSKSIKLTEKSIIEANRPVIIAYMDVVNIDAVDKFLIIKNFGQTSAVITEIKTKNLVTMLDLSKRLESLSNITFAPNQKIITEIIPADGLYGKIQPFEVSIKYRDALGSQYEELFQINPQFTEAIVTARKSSSHLTASDAHLGEIASALIKELK